MLGRVSSADSSGDLTRDGKTMEVWVANALKKIVATRGDIVELNDPLARVAKDLPDRFRGPSPGGAPWRGEATK